MLTVSTEAKIFKELVTVASKGVAKGCRALKTIKATTDITDVAIKVPSKYGEKKFPKSQIISKHFELVNRAENVNAKEALIGKYNDLISFHSKSPLTRQLPDGRIRYYAKEYPSKTPGNTTRGRTVLEFNPQTRSVRSWFECYDQKGCVNRVHPKRINGKT